jgi:hypothetical protein
MVIVPSLGTLKKYGLTEEDWKAILDRQNGVCAICKKEPKKGRLCVEHEHVKGWKYLPDEERKKYVRGLCCFMCNTQYLGRCLTIEKAKNVVKYLEEYEERKWKASIATGEETKSA